MKKKYYCPRCKNKSIIEYDTSFDCPLCKLEFDKEDFENIKDKSTILSLEEKQGIKEVFNDMKKEDQNFKNFFKEK